MDRLLVLGAIVDNRPTGGREMLSATNLALLRDLLGDQLVIARPARASSGYRDAWRGYVDGVDDAFIAQVLSTINAQRITRIFVDGSNFGAAIAAIKRAAPTVRIDTFFHNVEARFFWGSMRMRRTPKSLAVLAANYIAERQAIRASDGVICLSERDSAGLRRLYGRGADWIAPIVLEDKRRGGLTEPSLIGRRYALFVGGGFYANIGGIRWFARSVAPKIDLEIVIAGRGMDELASELADIPNITVIGAVDDLEPWYVGAAVVIAPIFDGSGMKTKVAEALMFGKHVVGTSEAFSGYAEDVVAANALCADVEAFITAIAAVQAVPPPAFDPAMRALYDRDHSPEQARARLARILEISDQVSVS